METIESDEYQLSPRVTLRRGDRIRVTQGPYWRGGLGIKIPMWVRGEHTFTSCVRRGKLVLLVAVSRAGVAILHVEGRRKNKLLPEMVCRPYRVRRVAERRRPRASKRQEA